MIYDLKTYVYIYILLYILYILYIYRCTVPIRTLQINFEHIFVSLFFGTKARARAALLAAAGAEVRRVKSLMSAACPIGI